MDPNWTPPCNVGHFNFVGRFYILDMPLRGRERESTMHAYVLDP